MKQIVCMNWGTAYGPEYVNRLYNMVARNVTGPFKFVCLTDSEAGMHPEIDCHPCPEIDLPANARNGGWRKITLWDKTIDGFDGGDVLFLDLDVVITDNIDCFFEHPGDFIVCYNWTQPNQGIGNTSVYRFRIGAHTYLLEKMVAEQDEMLRKYRNEQTYVSYEIKPGSMSFWPDEWCRSFKVHCVPKGPRRYFIEPPLPAGAKIVAFPGVPNPPEAAAGRWPSPWHKRIYKYIRPTRWVQENWQ